jgi:class 3 adenylate cyclase/tetratricopeptide (TPR) repeat protein
MAAPSPQTYIPAHLVEKILTSKSALEGERKQVTVLFADLKSSMKLLADRDPEEARAILDPVLERMMAAVHRYEGTVNQVMGGGIMALFGAPIAHEDHAVRACYAALAMQAVIRRYSDEVRRGHGLEVQIRVGLNAGEVVVRAIGNDLHMEYSAIGQTTHLAARMEQLAPPGTIRLTGDTLRLAEGFVQVTPLGPVPVKGLPAPVEVYELFGAGPARTRLQAFAARGLTPFVGRQAELEALYQALAQAEAGHGQVVSVIGKPGVGKTRLFHEFAHTSHTHGWLRLESRSASYGKATPYLPIIDLLKAYFQLEDRDDGRRMEESMAQLHQRPHAFPGRLDYLALLAETYARVGQLTKGLEALAAGLATVAKSGGRWWKAELYRLRGELLLQQTALPPAEVEACFRQALDVARRQQAKSLELRAAMSLSRLWQRQGKRDEAHALLAPLYGWLTEGFDTAELREARALLETSVG